MSVRAMLARVQRLEQARAPVRSPFAAAFGAFEAFAAECEVKMDAGDSTSLSSFIACGVGRQMAPGVCGRDAIGCGSGVGDAAAARASVARATHPDQSDQSRGPGIQPVRFTPVGRQCTVIK